MDRAGHLIRICLGALAMLTTPGGARAQGLTPYFPSLRGQPLVYLDDTVLTAYQFGSYLAGTGSVPTGRRLADLDSLRSSLESFIDEAAIVLAMDTMAIVSDPAAARRGRWRRAHAAGEVMLRRYIVPRIQVSDEQIRRMYEDSLTTRFTAPRKREVRQILIAPKWDTQDGQRVQLRSHLDSARAQAEALRLAVEAGAAFEKMARAHSEDTLSRAQGGYLGWIYPGNTTHDFDTAAFAAEVGKVRGPIKTVYGYHLILVEAERPESTLALSDSIAAVIRRQLSIAEAARLGSLWADSLIQVTRWTFNDDLLSDSVMDAPDSAWVALLNERDTLYFGEWRGTWDFHRRNLLASGLGMLEARHQSIRRVAFALLYLQVAEDTGVAGDPLILSEHRLHLRSEALREARQRLRVLTDAPIALPPGPSEGDPLDVQKPLRVQLIRARDSASIWSAYKRLLAGKDVRTVVRWYHGDMREARNGSWDRGWVGQGDLAPELFRSAWILNPGGFSRPFFHDGSYVIVRLAGRKPTRVSAEELLAAQSRAREQWRAEALARWRAEVRRGHTIRINLSTWQRVGQLWRR